MILTGILSQMLHHRLISSMTVLLRPRPATISMPTPVRRRRKSTDHSITVPKTSLWHKTACRDDPGLITGANLVEWDNFVSGNGDGHGVVDQTHTGDRGLRVHWCQLHSSRVGGRPGHLDYQSRWPDVRRQSRQPRGPFR